MKKSNRDKPQVRRKKTVEQMSSDRKIREQNQKKTAVANEPAFDKELTETSESCNQLILAAAQVGKLISNRELLSNIEKDKLVEFRDQAVVFAKDVGDFKDRLRQLDSHLEKIKPGINDPDNIMEAFTMGQGYSEFVESFNNVVLPNQISLLETIEQATEKSTEVSE